MRDSSDISRDNTGAGPNINSNKIALSKYALYKTFESTFAALNSFINVIPWKLKDKSFLVVFSEQPLDTRHSGPSQSRIIISLSYVAN